MTVRDGPRRHADVARFPGAVWRAIQAAGIAPAVILDRAGLPRSYADPSTSMSTAQYFSIWKAAEALADDPGFAVRLVRARTGVEQQPGFIVGLYASSFRDALERLMRSRLSASERLWTREAGGIWTMGKDWRYAAEPEPALSVDLTFALVVELGRRGTGRHIRPAHVQYARPRHPSSALEAYYGCAPSFDAAHNMISFTSEDLDTPFPRYSPEFVEVMTRALSIDRGKLPVAERFSDRVRAALKQAILNGRPEMAAIASDMGLGVRTLQRRITRSGTTFRALLNEARREVGVELVASADLDVGCIAAMLGYQDAGSFYRAFKSWEGVPFGKWRAQHGVTQQGATSSGRAHEFGHSR